MYFILKEKKYELIVKCILYSRRNKIRPFLYSKRNKIRPYCNMYFILKGDNINMYFILKTVVDFFMRQNEM